MTRILVWALALVALSAVDARAQLPLGSFKGYLTGHVGAINGSDLSDPKLAVGGSISMQEETGWGAEFDFGHTSDAVAGRQVLDVTSYLLNAKWVKPTGIIRPFAIAGGGVLQVNGCDAPCNRAARTYDFGLSAGGGAYVAVNDMIGFRADARYFFSSADHPDLGRPDNFQFWRVSFGATFMWTAGP
ncbi:MAG TPA: outer membrane beta-barrel protein [Vicinamibacterales bacterium]|nr:outer membrane beta-barrel protein [Vicinamibacterales bacterium]